MENKQLAGILLLFVGIIVVLALFPAIASNQAVLTQTYTETKTAQTIPTVATDLTGQELIGTATVVNQSGAIDCSANYTIAEGVSSVTGTKRVIMTPTATDASCTVLNYTYVYGAEGYADDAGARGIAGNILLFCALALLGFVIFVVVKNGGLDFLNR